MPETAIPSSDNRYFARLDVLEGSDDWKVMMEESYAVIQELNPNLISKEGIWLDPNFAEQELSKYYNPYQLSLALKNLAEDLRVLAADCIQLEYKSVPAYPRETTLDDIRIAVLVIGDILTGKKKYPNRRPSRVQSQPDVLDPLASTAEQLTGALRVALAGWEDAKRKKQAAMRDISVRWASKGPLGGEEN